MCTRRNLFLFSCFLKVRGKEPSLESQGHDIQGSELGLDRTTWKGLGLEATSRMGRSDEGKQVQFRIIQVQKPEADFRLHSVQAGFSDLILK